MSKSLNQLDVSIVNLFAFFLQNPSGFMGASVQLLQVSLHTHTNTHTYKWCLICASIGKPQTAEIIATWYLGMSKIIHITTNGGITITHICPLKRHKNVFQVDVAVVMVPCRDVTDDYLLKSIKSVLRNSHDKYTPSPMLCLKCSCQLSIFFSYAYSPDICMHKYANRYPGNPRKLNYKNLKINPLGE